MNVNLLLHSAETLGSEETKNPPCLRFKAWVVSGEIFWAESEEGSFEKIIKIYIHLRTNTDANKSIYIIKKGNREGGEREGEKERKRERGR